jgi:hypothetical protein
VWFKIQKLFSLPDASPCILDAIGAHERVRCNKSCSPKEVAFIKLTTGKDKIKKDKKERSEKREREREREILKFIFF